MKKGDFVKYRSASHGDNNFGVVIDLYTLKAKNIVNRGGHIDCVLILKEDGRLIQLPIIPSYNLEIVSES